MITAKIIGFMRTGTTVSAQYALSNGEDGQVVIPAGSKIDEIKSILASIVDAANYAESLVPLIETEIASGKEPPPPIDPTVP